MSAFGYVDGCGTGAMMRDAVLTGAEAMARAAEIAGVRIAPIFPITPQTSVIETLSQNGVVETLRANSEYNVMAMAAGVAWAGQRVFTVTSSQGLVMMSEMMWEVAGNRLPVVMGVFGRALKGPGWNLGTQQNDSLMMRDTGWLMFYAETAQEILDFVLIAYRVAEKIKLPAMVVGDGFYLSHTNEVVSIPDVSDARRYLPAEPVLDGLPNLDEPATYGPLTTPAQHFDFYRAIHEEMERLGDTGMQPHFTAFREIFGRDYDLIETINVENAEIVIVSIGTIAGTARALIQGDLSQYADVGLVKLRSMRPFPGKRLARALSGAKKVVVLDRNLSPCIGGIVAAEVSGEIQRYGEEPLPWVYSVVTGLGGAPVTKEMIATLLDDIRKSSRPNQVMFLR
jgi:pyruvate/2-oxoacid:ferredoxin oxidoreductase alpha subunit